MDTIPSQLHLVSIFRTFFSLRSTLVLSSHFFLGTGCRDWVASTPDSCYGGPVFKSLPGTGYPGAFRGLRQSLLVNSGYNSKVGQGCVLFQFTVHHTIILCHIVSVVKQTMNKRQPSRIYKCSFSYIFMQVGSRVSSGSIVSDYGLDDRAIGVWSPAEAKDFSSSLCVQTGSGSHPASCTMGTGGPFPGGKARPGRDADHSPLSSAEVVNE
jgi:hypothetical protein